ncbi:MAG: hypothetical protein R3A52_13310 [Polyangiales bacterium]
MSTPSPLTDDERVEVEVRHLKLASGTHYETLDVAEGVDRTAIQSAHGALRRRLGDMLRRTDPGDRYYTLVFELLRAIDDATAVLTDTQQRLLYDSSLRRKRQGGSRPPSGEHTRRDDAQGVFHQPFSLRPTGETPRVASVPPDPIPPSRRPTQPAARPVGHEAAAPAGATPVVPPPLHRRTPIPAAIEPRSPTPLPFMSSTPTPSRSPSMPRRLILGATRSRRAPRARHRRGVEPAHGQRGARRPPRRASALPRGGGRREPRAARRARGDRRGAGARSTTSPRSVTVRGRTRRRGS